MKKINGQRVATFSGLVLFIGTVAEAVRATYKSSNKIKQYKEENKLDKVPFKTVFKLVWKNYIPTALGLTASSTLIIVGDRLGEKRCMGLMAAYTASENTIKELANKTKEVVGEDTYKKIEDKIAEEKIDKVAEETKGLVITGAEQVILEPISGQMIKRGSWNNVLKIQNNLNRQCVDDDRYSPGSGSISFNYWLSELGLDGIGRTGDEIGWTYDDPIDVSATVKDVNGVIYVCINYENRPSNDLRRR